MKNDKLHIIAYAAILSILWLASCYQHKAAEEKPFKLPKLPVVYKIGDEYLQPDSTDTSMRLDSLAQRIYVNIHTLNEKEYKLWRVDTMQFRNQFGYADWPNQKHGYYWLFQGPSTSSHTKRDKNGRELEIYSRLDEHFVFHPVRQPEDGNDFPYIDYKAMDEYWSSIRADAVGIANPADNDLFVMAHPIRKHLRGPDQHYPTLGKDSIAVPFYEDKIDSTRMICIRISVMALND